MTDRFNINAPPWYGYTVEEYEKNIMITWENKKDFSKKIGDKVITFVHFNHPEQTKKGYSEIFEIEEGKGDYSDYVFYLSKLDRNSLEKLND